MPVPVPSVMRRLRVMLFDDSCGTSPWLCSPRTDPTQETVALMARRWATDLCNALYHIILILFSPTKFSLKSQSLHSCPQQHNNKFSASMISQCDMCAPAGPLGRAPRRCMMCICRSLWHCAGSTSTAFASLPPCPSRHSRECTR